MKNTIISHIVLILLCLFSANGYSEEHPSQSSLSTKSEQSLKQTATASKKGNASNLKNSDKETHQQNSAEESPQTDGEDEDVEEVTIAPVISSTKPQAPVTPQSHPLLDIIGRFHPAMVHFPIAWLMLLLLVDIVTFIFKKESWAKAGWLVLVITVLSFLPAGLSGFLRYYSLDDPDFLHRAAVHRNWDIAAFTLAALALMLRSWRRNQLTATYRVLYLTLVVASTAAIIVVGHLGGELVFGEDFF